MALDGTGDYITVVDAAAILGMSPGILDRWARQGRVRSELTANGTRILLRAEIVNMAVGPDDRASPG